MSFPVRLEPSGPFYDNLTLFYCNHLSLSTSISYLFFISYCTVTPYLYSNLFMIFSPPYFIVTLSPSISYNTANLEILLMGFMGIYCFNDDVPWNFIIASSSLPGVYLMLNCVCRKSIRACRDDHSQVNLVERGWSYPHSGYIYWGFYQPRVFSDTLRLLSRGESWCPSGYWIPVLMLTHLVSVITRLLS